MVQYLHFRILEFPLKRGSHFIFHGTGMRECSCCMLLLLLPLCQSLPGGCWIACPNILVHWCLPLSTGWSFVQVGGTNPAIFGHILLGQVHSSSWVVWLRLRRTFLFIPLWICQTFGATGLPRFQIQFHPWLVVWNMNFIFPIFVGMMIQSDYIIFFRGVETTNQILFHPEVRIDFSAQVTSIARWASKPWQNDWSWNTTFSQGIPMEFILFFKGPWDLFSG